MKKNKIVSLMLCLLIAMSLQSCSKQISNTGESDEPEKRKIRENRAKIGVDSL